MLAGFHAMDEHFRTAPFERNLPVLLGLLGVWYDDFFGAQTVAVLPYEPVPEALPRLPPAARHGEQRQARRRSTATAVDYADRPDLWGEPGTNGQHAFYQLIHQGTRLIPCDFIGFAQTLNPLGRPPRPAAGQRLRADRGARLRQDAPRRSRPRARRTGSSRTGSSRATARRTRSSPSGSTPATLGKLVALYEHSVFTQGAIWDIDSFDQWGVELGKVLAQRIIPELESADGADARPRQLDQRADPPLPASCKAACKL